MEKIKDLDIYTKRMRSSLEDKLFWIHELDLSDIDCIVDYGLSATKIRQAIIDKNIDYLERYLTKPVLENLEEIREYYLKIIENPKEDFSMI